MEPRAGAVSVHGASVRTRCRPRVPSPGTSPEKSEWKKVAHKFHCAVSIAKSSGTMVFELAAGVKKFCRRP